MQSDFFRQQAIPDANNIKCTSSRLGGGGLGKGQECTNGLTNSGLSNSKFIAFVFGENTSVPVVVSL